MDLQSIWNTNSQAAQQHYTNTIKANVVAIAQQKSQDILTSIHRNTLAELTFGFALLIGMSTFLWNVPKGLLLLFVSYSLITLWFSYQFWNRFRLQSKNVMSFSTKESLQKYIELLQSYKDHLWNYSVSLIPFTVMIGFIGGYCKGSNNQLWSIFQTNIMWISVLTILVLMLLGYLLLRWYFRNFLDSKLQDLQKILEDLEK